jgi:hypothetical protein
VSQSVSQLVAGVSPPGFFMSRRRRRKKKIIWRAANFERPASGLLLRRVSHSVSQSVSQSVSHNKRVLFSTYVLQQCASFLAAFFFKLDYYNILILFLISLLFFLFQQEN